MLAGLAARAGPTAAVEIGLGAAHRRVVASRGDALANHTDVTPAVESSRAALTHATFRALGTAAIDVGLAVAERFIHTVARLAAALHATAELAISVLVTAAANLAQGAIAAAVYIALEPVQLFVVAAALGRRRQELELRRTARGGELDRDDQAAH